MTDKEAEDIVKEIKETPQDWYFTFGFGQKNQNKYTVIHGTEHSARVEMIRRFGLEWAFQYPERKSEIVKQYQYEGEVK